ncbi:response regulator [Ideonella sp. DXS29W]|uniref:Response regulator n=1 Tax=Ideonella lacteola TaxID=2984193 RepID=A0ABU9BP92_9BURK
MSPVTSTVGSRRVLVVDDSRAMQAIIRRVLESQSGYHTEIETVASGEAALDALERFAPNLIVSDWHMPGMSGIELLQTLRQMGHSNLAVGFVTTETTPSLLQQALTNGAAFIVHKPFHDQELLAAVGNVLSRPAVGQANPPGQPPQEPLQGVRALRKFIQAWMPGVPFRVIEGEKFDSTHLTSQNLLAVYSPTHSNSLCALAAANMPALCMIGGSAIQADPKDIRRAIQDGMPNQDMVDSAVLFFRELTPLLLSQVGVDDAKFKGANMVARDFAKLRAAVDSSVGRADYRLSIPGYGDGRLVIIRA